MTDFVPTTDLSDAHPEAQVMRPLLRDFGGRPRFQGAAVTLRVRDHNPLIRARLQTPGEGKVLVVDGGGSLEGALVGGMLGSFAVQNGWEGVIVYGCVRDVAELRTLDLGVRALAAHPRRSGKEPVGEEGGPLTFAGVTVRPGDRVVADEDGVVVLPAGL